LAGKVFINYRRDDDPSSAARLRQGLAQKLGKRNLFMDVANLLPGQRFEEELGKALAKCDVLISVIGPRWLELLKSKSAANQRDYVCEEIAAALQRKIVVIPVRVGHQGDMQPLPEPGELPADIRDLVAYQKHDVAYGHFDRDIAELADAIAVVQRSTRPSIAMRRERLAWIGGVAAVAVVAALGAHYAGMVTLPLLHNSAEQVGGGAERPGRAVDTEAQLKGQALAAPEGAEESLRKLQIDRSLQKAEISKARLGPSFNCSTDKRDFEQAICSDESLSALDRELSDLFYHVFLKLDGQQQTALRSEQDKWKAQRVQCGPNTACLRGLYERRITDLSRLR
jgi:uncharacterized protein YecT (DUF1311 family)